MVTMRKFHENFLKKKRDNSVWRYPRKKKEEKKKERKLNHPKGEDLQKFHNRFFFFPQTSRFLFYPSRFEIDRVKTRKKKKEEGEKNRERKKRGYRKSCGPRTGNTRSSGPPNLLFLFFILFFPSPPPFFYIPVVMNVNNGGTLLHYSVQRRVGRRPTIRDDITTQVCTLGRLQSHYALLLIIVWSIASEGPSFLTMNRKNGKPVEPCSTTRLDILVIPSLLLLLFHGESRAGSSMMI